ncbi:MAG TPA: ROK family transcriptional regulator [Streptosporangiaceae bacterium]|nr:ROK family transcriptional regulator [Streptosporangiaceae bacterium]
MPDRRSFTIPARAGHIDIRRNNLEVVLRHLWAAETASRANIAARAGLTRATVSRLVAELIELGLVSETGMAFAQGQGRPATQLALSGQHVIAVGAEINVDYLAVLAVDLANREVYQQRRAFDAQTAGPARSVRALTRMCEACLAALPSELGGRDRVIAGLGIAIPGLIDEARATVSCAPNLSWDEFPVLPVLGRDLCDQAGVVTIGNDANRAAIAEYRVGSHAGTQNLVYVTGEVGIGGGMVVQGRPLLGSRGYGGEIGHMTLDPEGPPCGCGRKGCWEAYVGLNALLRASGAIPTSPGSPEDKIMSIVAAATASDPRILAALTELGAHLGIGAANIAKIMNPEVIILGGYFTALAEWILPPARESLLAGLLAPASAGCELTTSDLGFMAAARGAAIDILDKVITNPHRLLSADGHRR